jgi:hypothetical protein
MMAVLLDGSGFNDHTPSGAQGEPMTTAWIIWIALFFVIEGIALADKKKGDTLTEHFRKWFSLKHKGKGWLLRRGVLAAGLLWLGYHFFGE